MSRGKSAPKGKGSKGQNRTQSDSFLRENGRKPGIITTESGLQYEILEVGEGMSPNPKGVVTVHQRIKLIDGTPVADTYQKNSPESFDLSEAIEGYFEGLMLMNEGGRYRFYIPSNLAWGNRGAGSKIGPYAVIIIDCRLISCD